jgi:ABC-2 type transport system permease protein
MQRSLPARVDPVDGQVQPGQWAAEAGRSAAAADADWGLIATRIGFLAVLLLASATFATRAFNVYRRSIRARRES